MARKTKKLLALFVTFVLVLGILPVQGLAFAADSTAGGNAVEMSGTGTPTGTTGSGSQTPNNEQQVVPSEQGLEEDGNALEEGMAPQSNLTLQNAPSSDLAPTPLQSATSNLTLQNAPSSDPTDDPEINEIIGKMSLEDKIAQMIIPAIRTWDNNNVQTLDPDSALANALKAHPYGGIILFGQNVNSVEQTGNLVNALQANNTSSLRTGTQNSIPYLMCVDGEGGLVVRFTMGTRMTGSMAIGATGANAQANARTTGKVLGEEIAALGFTADFAPTIDVNSNPSNPVIGTRSFSDDPTVVGPLGVEFSKGLAQSNVVATYKHFPGHGDTNTDSHIGTPTVNKTEEELEETELVPFRAAIKQGADMIMTAHITLPKYDIEEVFADGTKGFFPATMSSKVLETLLRGKLGYGGVVITDALEMDALYEHMLVPDGTVAPAGEASAQRRARLKADYVYCANLAEKIINASTDILLIPTDLNNADAATFYDSYIQQIKKKVETDRSISEKRINESVGRILKLKKKYGILTNYKEVDIDAAKAIVGSDKHHADEMKIAREAITLVKNDDYTLPLSGHENNVVIMGRLKDDSKTIAYALDQLKNEGLLAKDAYINNLAYPDKSSGSENSKMHVTIDYYYDLASGKAHYTNDLKSAIASADKVICFTASYGAGPLAATSPLYQCVTRAMNETHAAGGKFILLANGLPYDVARYQDVDAAVLGYMAAGLGADPTDKTSGGVAYNANVVAALCSMFDDEAPFGTLPVNIYSAVEKSDRTVDYDMSSVLYGRGFGLNYEYAFVKGANGSYVKGSGKDLAFQNNARFDRLDKVLVDGEKLSGDKYTASISPTNISLKASYLDGVAAGKHTLTAVHEYGDYGGTKEVSTTFAVTAPVYTVKFVNDGGAVLQSSEVAYGQMPKYTGKAPTKAADSKYTYKFKGWSPAVKAVTGDATYIAVYEASPVSEASKTPMPKMTTEGNTALSVAWSKVDGATGYDVFFSRCNHDGKRATVRKVATMGADGNLSWDKGGLKPGTPYKVRVKAYVVVNGKKRYISTSPLMHLYTEGGKYTNAKAVKLNRKKVTLKKGKSFWLKATVKKMNKGKKLMPKSHVARVRYLSTDRKVATVTAKGKIKARKAGTCYVYAYAHNGVSKRVKVTVK